MTPVVARPAAAADIADLSAALARAFRDDPVMSWMVPDPRRREVALPGLYAALPRHHYLRGGGAEVATGGAGRIGAAALWAPPQHWQSTPREFLAMAPAMLRALGRDVLRGKAVDDAMQARHPAEPHWYLGIIGSDPDVRGDGYGAALMRSRLSRCDREFAPAYLESSNADNVPYYQRFGFTVTGEIVVPDGPTLWQMWRNPG